MTSRASHVWMEDGEGLDPDDEWSGSVATVMWWRCSACAERKFTYFHWDPDRPKDPEEAWPPCESGCDPAIRAVYDVLST